ncbi:unnamed protein product [Plutella xylostella]|uniref:(diamondback moth) hypothetical protein n=1 Tax=Plutella xylostella TaxID=51655 RepID=A0A8S4EK46_PLUXY|nr:unnamed protein product [Plutella xylostella]
MNQDTFMIASPHIPSDYSLDIRDVTLDDDAKYQCQVSSGPRGNRQFKEVSEFVRLRADFSMVWNKGYLENNSEAARLTVCIRQ